jgi:hypothetical protein
MVLTNLNLANRFVLVVLRGSTAPRSGYPKCRVIVFQDHFQVEAPAL